MSQPGSQPRISSESFSNAPRPLLAPDMLPPNSLSGKRLVFTSPLPPTRPTNNPAVASLRLLHSKTETSFATVSSKLDGLVSAMKHGHREMAELAQLQQDELAEVKRELQEHVSRAQVATQASFSSEVQSLKGHVDDALVSSSSLLNDAISKLSRLEDALYVQIQEQKVLETRIEALTQKLVESHDSAVNNHQLRHELDSRLLQMQRELHRNFCSEISKLSEKLNRFAPAGDPNTLQPSICDSQTQHVATVNLNPHTYSSLDPSPDATAVNPSLIYRTPPTKPSKRSLKSNTVEGPVDELCDGLFELQDIDLPPTRPTVCPDLHSSAGTRTICSSEACSRYPGHEKRKKPSESQSPAIPRSTVLSQRCSASEFVSTPRKRCRRIRAIDDEAVDGLPVVDGFA